MALVPYKQILNNIMQLLIILLAVLDVNNQRGSKGDQGMQLSFCIRSPGQDIYNNVVIAPLYCTA